MTKSNKKIKRSRGCPVLKEVSKDAIDLCLSRLEKPRYTNKKKTIKHLVVILRKLFSINKEGIPGIISLSNFKRRKTLTYNFGRNLRNDLESLNLIKCEDNGKWKLIKELDNKPIANRYSPSPELLQADFWGSERVKSARNYYRKIHLEAPTNFGSIVKPNPISKIEIPTNVKSRLEKPTGLTFSKMTAFEMLKILDPVEQQKSLEKLRRFLGTAFLTENQTIIPLRWKQAITGRIYASKPAIQHLPKIFRKRCLVSETDDPVFELDFKNFEIRILFKLAEETIPNDDIYQLIADSSFLDLDREIVKTTLIPILNKQTLNDIEWNRDLDWDEKIIAKMNYKAVTESMSILYPKAFKLLNELPDAELQRQGAKIFLSCLSKGIDILGTKPLIQIHDGVLLSTNEEEVKTVQTIFESESKKQLGVKIPAELTHLDQPKQEPRRKIA